MDAITRVPMEMVKMIPLFEGDARQLPLFIKKCEYILTTFNGNEAQMAYLFHVITSRLAGEAANLVGEREQIESWIELKQLLSQHFGDPRTEDCLAMELESIKINRGESYQDFCHRIQHIRSLLFAKLSETVNDLNFRIAKQHIYNNTSFKVFIYNIPAYLVRMVRLRNVTTLEGALKIVLEEQNFQTVYDSRNGQRGNRYPRQNTSNNHNNNFNTPRANFQQRQPNSPVAGTSANHQPFSSPHNSSQFRNYRPHNYSNNSANHRNTNVGQFNSPVMPRQHVADNAPRVWQNNAAPRVSGSNTDVTMRTASSRRINYIDNDTQNYEHRQEDTAGSYLGNPMEETVENFYIRASTAENR